MAKGNPIPTASVPIGDTGRLLALNEYKDKVGLVVGRTYKGSFYIDFVKRELNDGREFTVPMGAMGFESKEELVDQLIRLAEKISADGSDKPTQGNQREMFDDGDDDAPF